MLLKCLLAAPGYWLTREQLIELLWPEQDVALGRDFLRHTLSRLRRTLEPTRTAYDQSPFLASDRDMVWLVRDPEDHGQPCVWVDRDHFERLATTALRQLDRTDVEHTSPAEQLAEKALDLYGDHFLPADLYADWAKATRSRCQQLWATLVQRLADTAFLKRQFDRALVLLTQLVEATPDDERSVSRLMHVQALRGQRGEALRIYRALCVSLSTSLGAVPISELQQLADAIRAGEIPQHDLLTLPR